MEAISVDGQIYCGKIVRQRNGPRKWSITNLFYPSSKRAVYRSILPEKYFALNELVVIA